MKSDDDKMEGGGGSRRSNEHLSPNLNSIHQVLTNWSYIHAGGNHITISFLFVYLCIRFFLMAIFIFSPLISLLVFQFPLCICVFVYMCICVFVYLYMCI